ncbi:U4/U6.U5 small nuclear ribonucleoprotein component, putative [Candida dubliniensis CD36]|uniref:U4/U6.U5 small nuclear ribonucleoprotein component, putative n=1 Tax=Candida dubliniensis (strain CD36 / ATCC MYA-646 / CBS 7987 / NCPF 3949 / NRRL Y-17841) TaxID=573826 RepID=B9WAT6_CANDC|nr:U4/U6.U5 small nuclear ribonucleoprotein component, putative [Candida dubliniensis CD36]CAX43506.1 U4/U6.U5 small nuclear ribonucleoprotein component, putative [Candida dubliniensis CD36]
MTNESSEKELDKISTDQYGRKKWNVDLYEKEAKDRTNQSTEPSNATTTNQINDHSSSLEYIEHRNKLLNDSINAVKQYSLINPQTSTSTITFGKNKRFGFFCPICDVSFRDNLLLIDHLNSPQHVSKARQMNTDAENSTEEVFLENGIRRASLKEVISTMEKLVAKSISEKGNSEDGATGLTFKQRVEKRREYENRKRSKRAERKQVQRQRKKHKKSDDTETNAKINDLMGFNSFGSTKLT